jgi:hypothetical protein
LDAYLGGRGIDQRTFERQSKRLDDDEAEVRNRLDLVTPQETDLARTIDFAQALLQDLPGCWNRLDPQHRPQFVAALYPTGLVYEDGAIGTTHQPWWMTTFGAASSEDSGLAALAELEPETAPPFGRGRFRFAAVTPTSGRPGLALRLAEGRIGFPADAVLQGMMLDFELDLANDA